MKNYMKILIGLMAMMLVACTKDQPVNIPGSPWRTSPPSWKP